MGSQNRSVGANVEIVIRQGHDLENDLRVAKDYKIIQSDQKTKTQESTASKTTIIFLTQKRSKFLVVQMLLYITTSHLI